jgi:hypothetical protein
MQGKKQSYAEKQRQNGGNGQLPGQTTWPPGQVLLPPSPCQISSKPLLFQKVCDDDEFH